MIRQKKGCFFPDFFPVCCPCSFLQVDSVSLCLDGVLPSKIAIKESSFCHLRQCFLTMPAVNKHFDAGARRAAIELWRAEVPQRNIMNQLGMN
jgi:hypothetical protein